MINTLVSVSIKLKVVISYIRNLNRLIIITFNSNFEFYLYYDLNVNYSIGFMREKVDFEKSIVRLFREIVFLFEK